MKDNKFSGKTSSDATGLGISIIKKRDGRYVQFDFDKIRLAILAAGEATGEFGNDVATELSFEVHAGLMSMPEKATPSVEDVQDIVESVLLRSVYIKTAKAFILYRDVHSRVRQVSSSLGDDLVDKYISCSDWKVKENSNMSFSLQGLNNYISTEVSKLYWLNKIYTSDIRDKHISGDFHIHDLGSISVYCVGWDLKNLLHKGFKGVSGKIESRPARHFRSALGQVVNFFYTLQGEAAGAQAFSNFDTLLAPYIRRDKLSYDEVKQSIQEFLFNLNVPTRVGFQTPFTNVTMDLQIPATLAENPVIVDGEDTGTCYGDYQQEVNMLNRAFLEVMCQGDAQGRVFTFPVPTYNITEDFDWDDKNLDLLWKATAKYGIPNFANFVNSDLNPEDARSMCCRLRLDTKMLEKRGGGLFGANPLTGSIGVVTINMPRLGFQCDSEKTFMSKLGRLMDLARESLETKRKVLENLTDNNLYPYTKYYLKEIKDYRGSFWCNHFSTIGLTGMNEACLNLLGEDIGSEQGKAFAEKILDFMRERLIRYQEETGNLYNLEATPAEGTTYRLARLDKALEGEKHFANGANDDSPEDPFYTNSTQLPVNYTDDVFQLLDLQDSLQSRYTGGTVQHIFLGEAQPDIQAVKAFIRKICSLYTIPYFTISPTFSICSEHGYLTGEQEICPQCGNKTEIYSRVVGYLRPVDQWNKGKLAEFELRDTFKIN